MSYPSMESVAMDHLSLRRKLGFIVGDQARRVLSFARYADRAGHQGPITTELAVGWATLPQDAGRACWAQRLGFVRQLARYQATLDPRTEIPPDGLLGPYYRRIQPHIYSEDELAALLRAAEGLGPPGSLRSRTFTTLFGLLASTGLRISEAVRLTRANVDLVTGMLRVSATKFRKSRLVPLHPSTAKALKDYAEHRDRRHPLNATDAFFVSARGKPVKSRRVQDVFPELRRRLGWSGGCGRRAPRIHDLRHTFACRRLLAWYAEGADLARMIPVLSTYLGHTRVTDTYWYLTATPELLAAASARFEQQHGGAR